MAMPGLAVAAPEALVAPEPLALRLPEARRENLALRDATSCRIAFNLALPDTARPRSVTTATVFCPSADARILDLTVFVITATKAVITATFSVTVTKVTKPRTLALVPPSA